MQGTRAAAASPFASMRGAERSRKSPTRASGGRAPTSVEVTCGAKNGIFVVATQLVTCRCDACRADSVEAFTPSEFERHGGKENLKKWKLSIAVPSAKKTLGAWLAGYDIASRDFRIGRPRIPKRGSPDARTPSAPPAAPPSSARTPSAPIRAIRPSAPSAFRVTHPLPAPPLPAPPLPAPIDPAVPTDPTVPAVPAVPGTFSARLDAALQSRKKPKITGWRVTDSDEISVSLDLGSVSFSGTLKESPKLMAGAMDFERRGYIPIPTAPIMFMTGVRDATMIIPPDFFRKNILAWPMYCLGRHAVWMDMYMKWIVIQRNRT